MLENRSRKQRGPRELGVAAVESAAKCEYGGRNKREKENPNAGRKRLPAGKASAAAGHDYLRLFRRLPLLVCGELYIKPSKLKRSKCFHAEFRGETIVVFRNPELAASAAVRMSDIVAVLLVRDYAIRVVQRDRACARIFFLHKTETIDSTSNLMYIKVLRGNEELDAWRQALASAINVQRPNLSSLTVESVIGRGGGGKVFMVRSNDNDMFYALKVIDKAQTFRSAKSIAHVASERYLMEKVGQHPFVLQMQFAFQTENNLFIGTPLCAGGDLATYLRNKGERDLLTSGVSSAGDDSAEANAPRRRTGRLGEDQTRRIACEIMLGIEHLHKCGIVYRDMKPENIFIDGSGHVKLGDLGLAKHLMRNNGYGNEVSRTASVCGTRNYLPPEMLFGRLYAFETDMWSLGVMLYRMLCGCFPFDGHRTKEVFHKVKREAVRVPASLSTEARSLLVGLLEKHPVRRLTISQAKDHEFFEFIDWDIIASKGAGPSIPDVEFGSNPIDALNNFEVSKLQGISMGEYVTTDSDDPEASRSPASPRGKLFGFEYGEPSDDAETEPLAVVHKAGVLHRIASMDPEIFHPLTPKRSRASKEIS